MVDGPCNIMKLLNFPLPLEPVSRHPRLGAAEGVLDLGVSAKPGGARGRGVAGVRQAPTRMGASIEAGDSELGGAHLKGPAALGAGGGLSGTGRQKRMGATEPGVSLSPIVCVLPRPSWPRSERPQQRTLPSSNKAQL